MIKDKVLVGIAIIGVIGGASLYHAGEAGATNLDVSVGSKCVGTTWVVTPSVHNVHTAPLHFVFDNSVKKWSGVLAAGASDKTDLTVPGDKFSYTWSTTDGILVGKTSDTLSRPSGCQLPTPTTVISTVPATVPTTVPTTTPTTAAPPPSTTPPVPNEATSLVPPPPTPSSAPPHVAQAGTLPATGGDDTARNEVVAFSLACLFLGVVLVVRARAGKTS